MIIAIPTYQRPSAQKTWISLPVPWWDQTFLVVRPSEVEAYKHFNSPAHLCVLPEDAIGIVAARNHILDRFAGEKVLMLDDDLTFAARREDEPSKFREATEGDLDAMLRDMELLLGGVVHAGIAHREGANRVHDNYTYTGRMMRAVGYNTAMLKQLGLRFDIEFLEDFNMNLNLLELGYNNCIINYMVQNQPGSNTPGGCSGVRTVDVQGEQAAKLAAAHPKYVDLVKKYTKTSWGSQERTDVRIKWKAAYSDGCRKRASLLDPGTGINTGEEGGGPTEAVE